MVRGKRVVLTEKARESIAKFQIVLKEKHCKCSPSDIVSYLTEIFFKKYKDKESKNFESKFFDEKIYLRALLKNDVTIDDIAKLTEIQRKKSKKIQKGKSGQAL